jgi:hypothetical protein
MSKKDKAKTESKQISEDLKVQVMLAIYQTDIQTQTAVMFGTSAMLIGIWAIFLSKPVLTFSLFFYVVISGILLYVMLMSGSRYSQRRKQLDNLRKKYCPDAYSV